MEHLSESQLRSLRKRLDDEYARLRGAIREELLRSDEELYSDLAGQVHDPGDASVADLLADLNISTVNRLLAELREVEAARERLREGSYGVCEDSGEPIPFARLNAYPTARRTVEYQERHEQMSAVTRARPSL